MKKTFKISLILVAAVLFFTMIFTGCADDGGFLITTPESLNDSDCRIAVFPGYTSAEKDIIPKAKRITYENIQTAVAALKENNADCIIIDKISARYNFEQDTQLSILDGEYGKIGLSVGFGKYADDFIPTVKSFISSYKEKGIYSEMVNRWSSGDSVMGKFEEPVAPSKIIRVGLCGTAKPYQFYDGSNNLIGFNVELIKRYAAGINAGTDIRVFSSAEEMVAKAEEGSLDIVLSCENNLNIEGTKLRFSDEYLNCEKVAVILRSRNGTISGDERVASDVSMVESVKSAFYRKFIKNDGYKKVLFGLENTFFILIIASVFAWGLGLTLCIGQKCRVKLLNKISLFFTRFMTLLPLMIILVLFCYIFFGKISISMVIPCGLGIGIYYSKDFCKALCEGIESVDRKAIRTLYALGYSKFKAYTMVVVPIAIKNARYRLRDLCITLFKSTAVVGYFFVNDLFFVMNNSTEYVDIILSLVITAVIYALFIYLFILLLKVFENGYRSRRRRRKILRR